MQFIDVDGKAIPLIDELVHVEGSRKALSAALGADLVAVSGTNFAIFPVNFPVSRENRC
jgi:hypothetical protein